ncbi:MAG TPA: metal ABC transporter permease [Gemmatimonadales bacterium]|nr:metal ABC transporter permease [Gemmatimonadales bacterium]
MSIAFEIQMVAIVTAVACALPGTFLVLRRMAMLSDAISHTVLLGIVLAYFVVRNLASPLLIVSAALMGVLTVALVEALSRTRLVKQDAAIGIVFPALFSIAVILVSRWAGDVHLDTDAVLLGELAFAPFRRFYWNGVDLGPRALWVMGAVLLLILAFIISFYKELKLSTFDPALAAALGFSPALLHYGFMGLVSVTAVGAFDAVGSVLVVALMIAPPATAYLLTDSLPRMLTYSALIAVASAVAGFWLAWTVDANIAGAMASMSGVAFLLAFLLAPGRGMVAVARRRSVQRVEFAQLMLVVHLLQHEDDEDAVRESSPAHLQEHLRWTPDFAERIVDRAERVRWITRGAERLELTSAGRERARFSLGE